MKMSLDDQHIALDCPQCRRGFDHEIGYLKHDPPLTCPYCGSMTRVDANYFGKAVAQVEKHLADIRKSTSGRFNFS
jgi:uncharacterized C2H2 Zn-finger protein